MYIFFTQYVTTKFPRIPRNNHTLLENPRSVAWWTLCSLTIKLKKISNYSVSHLYKIYNQIITKPWCALSANKPAIQSQDAL